MARTLVGLFDDESAAQSVAQDLLSQGFSPDDVSIVTSERSGSGSGGQIAADGQRSVSGNLPGNTTAGVFQALTQAGIARSEAEHYAEAVRRGSALVTVDADDTSFSRVQPIFDRYGNADIGGRGEYYRQSGFTGFDEKAPPYTPEQINTERQNLKLYAEQLTTNKQRVQAGEVTLHKEVITEQKTIDVPLTHEEVVVERHAVDHRPAADADFRDESISVPVMREQATAQKTAVVTGEVSIGKRQITETKHLSDTVRREEVRMDNPDDVNVVDRANADTDSRSDTDQMLDEEEVDTTADTTSRRGTF